MHAQSTTRPLIATCIATALGLIVSLCGADVPLNSAFVNDREPIPSWGGIAGVSYSEDFESHMPGPGCNQNGWSCGAPPGGFDIVHFPSEPTFGQWSAQDRAIDANPALQELRTPVFTLETGMSHTDIVISDNTSLFQWCAANLLAGAGSFNMRLNFETNGSITALMFLPGQCGTGGSFVNTTGTWSPNVRMRIGIEVLPGQVCRVYKDGNVIFTGTDIAQVCNPGDPDIGINNLRNFNSNVGNTATMTIDNISMSPTVNPCQFPLAFCRADVDPLNGNGVVNINDLLAVVATWGQTQNPPGTGLRPQGDCDPPPNGDCQVNINDLLAVISMWGACPGITGACCANGPCIVVSQSACLNAPNFGVYQGNFTTCAGPPVVVCPTPPANDLCANAATAVNGSNAWNNTNANLDGGTIPASCLPAGGGIRQDVWFRYTATCAGNLTIDTIGTAAPFTDTVLQVFDAWNCNPLGSMLGCNDDIDFAGNNWLSRVTVQVPFGQQVLIRCMSQSASPATNQGLARLNIQCVPFQPICPDATPISLGATINGTIQGTTSDPNFPLCLSGNRPLGSGRWYTIIGNGSTYTASTCNSLLSPAWDGQLAVYCGLNCEELTCIAGSSDFNCGPGGQAGTGAQEAVSWCARNGKKYWIFVGGDHIPPAPDGAYQLIVTAGAPCSDPDQICGLSPLNDLCVDAFPISDGTRTFVTTFASTDGSANTGLPPGVNCQDSGATQTAQDIWYRYVATCTGQLTVTTCSNLGGNSNYDSDLVLYPGSATCPPPGSSVIACNDDDTYNPCGSAPPWSSTMRANVMAGSSYIIRVGGWDTGDSGTGILNITCAPAVCGNGLTEAGEECDDANGNCGDGCCNCIAEAVCSTACTYNSIEACVQGADSTNGGCNTTPALYEGVALTGGSAVVCGSLWAGPGGTGNLRDIDWYAVTVGPSGTVHAHLTGPTPLPLQVQIGRATGPPGSGPCSELVLNDTATTTQGQCAIASVTNYSPGTTALIVVTTNLTFSGFPCSGGPWTYSVRVVSP